MYNLPRLLIFIGIDREARGFAIGPDLGVEVLFAIPSWQRVYELTF